LGLEGVATVDQAGRISNDQQFEEWLIEKPLRWKRDLEVRVALRVLPLVLKIFSASEEEISLEQKKVIALGAFRAGFVAWAAETLPDSIVFHDHVRAAAVSAARAITAPIDPSGADYAVANAANGAVTNAALAIIETAPSKSNVASAAANAASIGSYLDGKTDIWESIDADVRFLADGEKETLIDQPLWLNEVRRDPQFQVNFPLWSRRPFDAFDKSAFAKNGHWSVWLDWYRGILSGGTFEEEEGLLGRKLRRDILMRSDDFWNRSADAVAADIAGIINPQPASEPIAARTEATFLSDAHDPKIDFLDRARLAFVLAGRLNQIWDAMNTHPQTQAFDAADHQSLSWNDPLRPGFVVHIDAPWGGGKTSFSDFLARV
jgi:hypothetical protein